MPVEQRFSNREINSMFKRIEEKLDEHSTNDAELLTQVKFTNGKVADIQKWRERVNGGALVIAFIVPFLLAGVGAFTLILIKNEIREGIQAALSIYEEPQNEKPTSN